MATSSITKEFVIKDKKTCDKLIEVLNGKPTRKSKKSSNKYEEGKKLLEQYYSH